MPVVDNLAIIGGGIVGRHHGRRGPGVRPIIMNHTVPDFYPGIMAQTVQYIKSSFDFRNVMHLVLK